jgi:hypothetical protein
MLSRPDNQKIAPIHSTTGSQYLRYFTDTVYRVYSGG